MTDAWRDPRVPADDACVLRPLLERRAAETPGKVFARFADGTEWTYRDARDVARQLAFTVREPRQVDAVVVGSLDRLDDDIAARREADADQHLPAIG